MRNAARPPAPGRVIDQVDLGAHAARGVVNALQQRAGGKPAPGAQFRLQFVDHAFDFGEHDVDRDA